MKRIWILLLCALMLTVCLPVSAAEAEGVATTEKMTSLLSCDTVDYWRSEAEISLDTEDKTEGEACVSFAGSVPKDANQTVSIEAVFPSTNITGADALTFDFYISDPTLLRSTYILTVDLASSGGPESEMLDWSGDVLQSITEPGWYHVTLPFEKAINLGFNDTRVNYFRLYLFHIIPEQDIENAVVKIDNVAVRIPEYRTTMVESCDTVDGWTGNHAPYAAAPVLDTAVKKQGSGSLRYTVTLPEEVHLVSQKVYATPINAKGAAYVEMDVYLSDVNVLKNCGYAIQFEITSSGTCDHQEYSWSLDKYITKSGWTHIRLPMDAAGACIGTNPELAGSLDLSRVNYFRFHTLNISAASGNQFVFRVDNISFSFPKEKTELVYGVTPIRMDGDNGDSGENNNGGNGAGQDPVPDIPGPGDTTDANKEKELRARQTAQRAKILLLIMTFFVIAIDVVAVALKRKDQEEPAVAEGDVPPDEVT